MKKVVFSLVVIACLLTLGAGNAMAYSNINELLKGVYGSNYNFQLLDKNTAFDYSPSTEKSMNIKYTRPYAINTEPYTAEQMYTLGAYNISNLEQVPYFGVGTGLSFDFINSPKIEAPQCTFGLYLDYYKDSQSPHTTFYSRAADNSDVQHTQIYKIVNDGDQSIDGRYVVAFDDGDPEHGSGDFMDLVVEIHTVTTAPEFPTIALPVAAIIGLVFVFGLRKQ